ncbi:Predicted permease [Limimonas halophila]|uniref:Predicted permease n=1 Tax=Limimonas halophila TaxID=1082479 RepID=A0A1G7SRI6_9PROT|nr:AEC family transporter [Limimonas halophila]SDG25404.1 Predicted permease [Limimonas halophila]
MLAILQDVVVGITLPIVLLALGGYGLQKHLRFDVATLNRLLVYGAFPCFIIVTLAEARIPLSQVQGTALFTVVQFGVLLAVGWWAARAAGLGDEGRPLVALACAFPNGGNFGIPLIELAFGGDLVTHQVVIVSIHTVLLLLVVPLVYAQGRTSVLGHAKALVETPMLPAVAIGLGLNALDWSIPEVLRTPMHTFGKAYVGLALVSLGAQLARSGLRIPARETATAVGLRLLAAPLLTAAAVFLLPFPAELRALLLVSTCAPAGILLAIFAVEYQAKEELASAIVFVSTLLAPLVVTAALVAVRL